MKTEKRPFHCLRQSLTGWIGTAALLAWGGLAAPGALAVGGSGPAITVLEPDEGPVGTEVVIRGENFGSAIGSVQGTSGVSFGGVWASPSFWSEGEVRVEVPAGATTGPVVVTVSGVGSEGLAFTVTGAGTGGPAVGTVSPAQGAAGTEVVIRGTDFGPPEGAEQGTAGVSFNGVAGTPASWSEAEIRVAVPEGATAGPVVVMVGGQASNGVGFTVTAAGIARPSIVSVSPELATAGTEVVIRGENFGDPEGAAQGARGVSFNGVWAEPSFWSEGEIRVAVPEGAPGGQVVVVVDGEGSDGAGFTVTGPAPVIETVDPTHGPEGTGVVIRGEYFGSAIAAVQGTAGVSFNGVWADASFWSGTEIRAAVPEGGESGQVAVTAGGQESNGVDFTVPAGGKGSAWAGAAHASSVGKGEPVGPEITSVTPDSGPVGTSVTVAGTGFGAAQGTSTVSFNGAAGVPTSWSETEIRVPVPAGAATGTGAETCAPEGTVLTVEVTVGGQKNNGGEFLLDPPVIIEVSDNVVSEPDGEATITVRRNPFQYQTAAYGYRGTAKRGIGKDYVVDRLVFPPRGTNTAVVNLRVLDDQVYEGDETIEIVATVRDLGGKECEISEEILLKDDELPPLAISVITHQHGGLEVSHLREGEPAYRTFAVTVSVPEGEAPATDTTITLVSGGTASSETDYTLAETVTLGVGKRSVETPLTVIDDDPFEIPETLTLQATDGRNDGYQASPVVTVWIYDDNYSTLTVSAEAPEVSEPNGTVRVTASVEEGKELDSDATVFLGPIGTATHKTDYSLTKRLTLPANRSSVSTVLSVVDDVAYEGEETIQLAASGDGTSALGHSQSLTILLEDDDPAITGFTPTRGGAGVVVTISGDNLAGATAVRFGEGETSEIEGDSDTEIRAPVPAGAATGPITVVTPAGTATSTGIFTVRQLYLEVDPASVGEAAGQRTATVTVRVNEAVTATEGLTVTLAHPGTGKAARDTDYTLVRTVTIANTKTSAPAVTLTVVDDGEYEGEETILLQATAPDYGASREVTVTVEDDDPTITGFTPARGAPGVVVTISGDNFTRDATVQFNGVEVEASKVTVDPPTQIRATVPPGAATGPITVVTPGGTVASTDPFRVLRLHIQVDPAAVEEKAGKRTAMVTVSVDDAVDRVGGLPVAFTFGGTADRGRFEDYTMDQTVTITAGNTSAERTLTVRDDRDYEEEETITIQAGADGYEASTVAEVTLISDDLPEPVLACPLSLQESHGTEQIAVYLPFTGDVDTDFSFAFKGTATRGTDYTMVQMVTIDAGSTSAEIPLTVIDDRRYEGDETIDLEVSADGYQTVFCLFSIEDNDPVEPPLTLSVSSASVGEASGKRTAMVTVSVDEAVEADGGLPVTFTFGGTADRETDPDYAMDQTVTILNTKTSASATLTVIDDAVAESDETITITAGATDYSDSEAVTVTIADDDVPGVTVSEASLSITEGKSGTYEVKLDTQPTADVTITVASSDEGAVTVTPASLTFAAGNWNTARAVTVEAVQDEDIADETATLTHVAAGGDTNYAGIAIDSVSVSVTDDEVPGVTVTPTRLSITEGSSKSYRVKLKTRPSASVTVSMSSSNGDVGVPSTPLTFTTETGVSGGWDQFQSVSVRIAHDDNNTDETGTITHKANSDDMNYVREASINPSVSVSVTDDDPTGPEQLSLSLSPRSRVSEPSGTTTVWVSVPTAVGADTTVTLHHPGTGSGRATHGSDYTLAGSVTIPANQTSVTTTLTVVDDALDEPDETIQLYASATDYRDSPTRTVTIVDDDPSRLSLSVSPARVAEKGGTSTITVSVPSWAAPSSDLRVGLTHPGTGTGVASSSDYTLAGSVTIPANQTSVTTTLTVVDDALDEPDETIQLYASATDYRDSPTRTVTIVDDDPSRLSLSVSPARVAEKGGTSTITVSVPSWAAPSSDLRVGLTHPGTGTGVASSSDYTLAGSVTIPANQTSVTTTLTVVDDALDEPDETIQLYASATDYRDSPTRTVTIVDDDPSRLSLSVSPARVAEKGGTSTITVSVPSWAAPSSDLRVGLTHPGTGTGVASSSDYTLAGSVTIPANQTSVTTTLTVVDDALDESNETIQLYASATDYRDSPTRTVTIVDDDPSRLRLSVSPTSVLETGGESTITVSVPSWAAPSSDLRVGLTHPGSGTATRNSDYRLAGSVTLPGGSTSVTTTLTAVGDSEDEPDETVRIQASATGYDPSPERMVTIIENPPPVCRLSVSPARVAEKGGTSTITVSVPSWAAPSSDLRVGLTHPGTGTGVANSSDYTLAGSVTIPANQTSVTTTLTVVDDALDEPDETIQLYASATDYRDSPTRTVTIVDDDPSRLSLSVSPARVAEKGGTSTITVSVPSWAAPSSDLRVGLTHPGTGTGVASSSDYTLAGSVTIPANQTSVTTTLTVVDDALDEPDETIQLYASATDYRDSPTRTVTIVDDDPSRLSLSVSPARVAEKGGTSTITVSVPSWAAPSSDLRVGLTHPGTGTGVASSSDYTLAGSVTIPANQTSVTTTLTVVDDALDEPDETIQLYASATDYRDSPTRTVTIVDDDPSRLSLSVSPARVAEKGGTSTITVSVPSWAAPSSDLRVGLTHPGTGTGVASSSDYTLAGSVTIPANQTSVTTTLTVVDDALDESNETIQLYASATDYRDSPTRTVTIVDDDPSRLRLSVSPTSVLETGGESTITVSVPSWAAPSSDLRVGLTHPGSGTATRNSDYRLAGSVTLPGGSTSVTTTLTVVDDALDEPDETIQLYASATDYRDSPTRTVTIVDDDQPQKPVITSINPALQWLDDPVTIYGKHFGSTPGSVSFGGYAVGSHNFTGSNSGYSWSNASISLLIPGSIYPGHVSVTVTTHNGMTSSPYFYTVTDNPVQRGECDDEEDCPEEKEKEDSEDSGEGEEDPAEGGG